MKNKFLMGLLSLAISCALWMYVALVVSPETEATYENIPVVMDGTSVLDSRDLMIISDTNLKVNLKLLGNRQDLNKLNSSNITILADLSQITEPGEHNVKYSIFYPGTVQSGTIDPVEKNPQYVTVVVAERGKKTIPVEVRSVGSVPENFIADKAVQDISSITLTGPKDVVDQIAYARIVIDMTDRTTSFSNIYQYALYDAEGRSIENNKYITASATDIRVDVKIDQLKKVKLVYTVLEGGGIGADDVTITPMDMERTWITVRGSQAVLAKLNEIHVGTIDLSQITSSRNIAFSIKMPEGVENFSEIYTVEYHVDIPDLPILEVRDFSVDNDQFILENVPEHVMVKIYSQTCPVRLRGPADILEQLTAENIRVIVDYEAQDVIQPGNDVWQLRFEIVDADGNIITDVGVVPPENAGSDYRYTVNVRVETQDEDTNEKWNRP